ncbi:TonB-dependent receptor [Porticoccaceae bacterium LTM1]|nr:TonB-dependent receptor [Porticoccaceae bacterium LTM1]
MKFQKSILTTAIALGISSIAQADTIEEVIVTADFRDGKLLELPNSVTVIDQRTIEERNAHHIEQLINLAPNVNFSSGASRGRYFQVRGIGERSQFVEPLNPAVGVIVDGIDYTGLGLAANTLDIKQVEVLRGPQGTLYGANALAGLINLKSNDPTDMFTATVSAELADYNSNVTSAVISGPLNESVGYRLAVQSQKSDGFIENIFLNRDNTNNIDEFNVRGKLLVELAADLTMELTGHFLDVDNGYDAFSLDNTRETLSDEPGHDRQKTKATAVKLHWSGSELFDLVAVASLANSDTEYGYDEDWTYEGIHPWGYVSFDNYQRDNENTSVDIRWVSKTAHDELGWVAGIYHRSQQVDLLRQYTYISGDFTSRYETDNTALYGQLNIPLSDKMALITGIRYEQREAEYRDSELLAFDPDENLWGGRIALEYQVTDSTMLYGLVSRGYKAGGANSNSSIPADLRSYDTEFMWNYEAGLKGNWLDNRLQIQAALFYQDRKDVQAKQSFIVLNPDFSTSFFDYISNAAAGESTGFELELNFRATEQLNLFASIGLLNAEFDGFLSYTHADATDTTPVDLEGHDVAQAPNYQFILGGNYQFNDQWGLRVEVEGKDSYYFSDRHEEKSRSYELLNMRLNYALNNWELALFGRNLTNEDVYVRGFGSFGNDPRKFYITEPYYQYGEPRMVGVSANYRF